MRWLHIAIIGIFVTALLVFLVQNREIVSIDFLEFSVRIPLAVMAAIFYVLGALSGSSAFALLRRSVRGAGAKPVTSPG